MSTPPPNFGYTQATSTPPDRRVLRAQQQAAKVQARLGRDQARRQMRALQRRSVAGPLLLVTLGVLLLLLQSGRLQWSSVLTWLSLWWPAILIGTGLLLILEWVLDNRISANGGIPAPRRVLGGAATTLLLLLATAGASLLIAHRSSSFFRDALGAPLIGNGRNNWTELFGVHSDFTSQQTHPLSANGELTINDPHGDVTVTGSSEDGQVHVSVHQHLFSLGHDESNSRHTREEPQLHGDKDHLSFTSVSKGEDDADLTVTMPHNASLVIHSGHGDVSVEELHGATAITATNGDVKLTALRGPVRVDTQDNDSTITAHSLGGGLELNGHSGDIDLSDIEGGLSLHGDFFGTTQMERIRGNVQFQSSFTRFDCAGIPGNLVIEGRSDLSGKHLQGPFNLSTTDRNLVLDGVRGATTITDRNGSISVTLAAPLQPVHITNTNGTVDVTVPDHQPFTVHAKTQNAEVHDDFNLQVLRTESSATINGQVMSGGPELNIETTNDDIGLHTSAATDSTTWSDTPTPTPVATNAKKTSKHLVPKS